MLSAPMALKFRILKARLIKQCKEYILFYPIFRKVLVCKTLMKKAVPFQILDKRIYIPSISLAFSYLHFKNYY